MVNLQKAFIGSNLNAYRSNQLHSPLFLKETITTFLSIVIALRAPDFQLNSVFLVQKRDQNDTILLYGIIPLVVNYKMSYMINIQRGQNIIKDRDAPFVHLTFYCPRFFISRIEWI